MPVELAKVMTAVRGVRTDAPDTTAAINYTLVLVGILVLFASVNGLVRLSGARLAVSEQAAKAFSILYGFIYAMFGGTLIYFGVDHYNTFFSRFTHDDGVVELVSVSIVVMFCFLFAGIFHNTMSVLAGRRLKLNPFINIVGFVIARLLLIGGLVLWTP